MNLLLALYVTLGGAIGALIRYCAVHTVMRLYPQPFPLGTLLVNVIGSFIIGLLMARTPALSPGAQLFFVTGILGGFTTFSAFSWDALQLMQRGALGQAAFYIGGSVVLSLAMVTLGMAMGR